VTQAIAVAEETGALDRMLTDLAALHERQADTRIAALAGLAEPLVIAVMGVLVGALVLAMYLPIIEMGNVI
jgi:type IV pilus assembly protein PilC